MTHRPTRCPCCARLIDVPAHQHRGPWTAEARAFVRHLASVGTPPKMIARLMGVSVMTIHVLLYKERQKDKQQRMAA